MLKYIKNCLGLLTELKNRGKGKCGMQADYIKKIVKDVERLPYKAILYDGTWGIGKSYAINEALAGNANVCKISMFGLNNASQIYHEVLFQLALKNNIGGKIGEIAGNILTSLSAVWDKAAQAQDVIRSMAKERELFLLLSKEFKKVHIVVIDDLERIGDKVSLEEVFGIIEELKQCNKVKVILVAHTGEIKGKNKEIFDKYNEKVVDRIYHVTEKPEKINWRGLGIDEEFIKGFLEIHKVNNLRTLEKAQRFFEDVELYCGNTDEQFMKEIRLICFAIVVESTDNLYYREECKEDKKETQEILKGIRNGLEYRIRNYLTGIKSSNGLVTMLFRYYQDNTPLDANSIMTEYRVFKQAGNKANYFKTDEEIRELLPDISKNIDEADNLIELNKFVDEYIVWSDILKEENETVLQRYREKLREGLKGAVLEGKEEILSYGYDMYHLSSEQVKKIYWEESENARKFVIKNYLDYLKRTTIGEKAYEYSYRLRNYFNNSFYREIICESVGSLYHRKSFPVDEIDEKKYYTSYNIMYVLYHVDSDRFLGYCDELSKSCDCMSVHRIDVLVKEIIKEGR